MEVEKSKKIDTKSLKYKRDKDQQKVRGIFRFFEVPGGSMSFVFKEYKDVPAERYDFVDGQIYEIPLGVARHLNKNLWYPVHQYMTDENGKHIAKIGQKVRRCSFQSLEFIDEEDLRPIGNSIVTAELTSL